MKANISFICECYKSKINNNEEIQDNNTKIKKYPTIILLNLLILNLSIIDFYVYSWTLFI